MSDKEREAMERKGFEEQKLKEALAEKQPDWQLYSYSGPESFSDSYWIKMIDDQFEQSAGDENDRWTTLQQQFRIP